MPPAKVSSSLNEHGLLLLPVEDSNSSGPTNRDPVFDLVAVHGLNGGRWSTWARGEVMWLQHLLPQKLPHARVMTFGYNADLVGNFSVNGIRDHARTLLTRLRTKRQGINVAERPIVFVCHSLGGILVKQMLRFANNEDTYKDIALNTRGIAFIGTPHRGSDLAYWGKLIAGIAKSAFLNPKTQFIKDLTTNSQTLMEISEDFRSIADKYKIVSFYEDEKLRGVGSVVVPKSSALMEITKEEAIPLEGNHMEICKFSRLDDDGFEQIWSAIERIANESRAST